jgi:hypothetical protein
MVLRGFLYEGFNQDENGRRVFDGIFAHVAGGRRSTFQRFTQPSRTAGPLRNASLSPTEQFPYSDVDQLNPYTGIRDGVLKQARAADVVPKIIYTNSSYEYWGSAASLLHTTPDGTEDAPLPATTRMYLFTGGQHGPAAFPPVRGRGRNLPNFNNYQWPMRRLLLDLREWAASGKEPPSSIYPSIQQRTLVPLSAYRFPAVPGVDVPTRIHTPHQLDFSTEPPRIGKAFGVLVPQADADGNDIAGIRVPEIECPIGSYTGWNLRSAAIGAPEQLLGNTGSWIPFARTPGNDPRRAIVERYASESEYAACIERSAKRLVDRGLLLPNDVPEIAKAAAQHWKWRMESFGDEPLTSAGRD